MRLRPRLGVRRGDALLEPAPYPQREGEDVEQGVLLEPLDRVVELFLGHVEARRLTLADHSPVDGHGHRARDIDDEDVQYYANTIE